MQICLTIESIQKTLLRHVQTCVICCVKRSKIDNYLSEHILHVCEFNLPTLLHYILPSPCERPLTAQGTDTKLDN